MNCAALMHWRRLESTFLLGASLSVVLGAPCSGTAQTLPPRQPVGIYDRLVIQGLNVQMVGQTVQLTWLATTPAAYQLQVNHKLSDPNGWKPASQTPIFIGDYCQVSLNPAAAASFFRLAPP